MKTYLGITSSRLYLDALVQYDATHPHGNLKMKSEKKRLTELKNAARYGNKYLEKELEEAKNRVKELSCKYEVNEKYLALVEKAKEACHMKKSCKARLTRDRKRPLKDEEIRNLNKLFIYSEADENKYTQAAKKFLYSLYKSEEYMNANKLIDEIRIKRKEHKENELLQLQSQIEYMMINSGYPAILGMIKTTTPDELKKTQETVATDCKFIANGKYAINNIDVIIGPGSGGSKLMIDLKNPSLTYFIRNCIVQDDGDNHYRIMFENDDDFICIAEFVCNQVVTSNC